MHIYEQDTEVDDLLDTDQCRMDKDKISLSYLTMHSTSRYRLDVLKNFGISFTASMFDTESPELFKGIICLFSLIYARNMQLRHCARKRRLLKRLISKAFATPVTRIRRTYTETDGFNGKPDGGKTLVNFYSTRNR